MVKAGTASRAIIEDAEVSSKFASSEGETMSEAKSFCCPF